MERLTKHSKQTSHENGICCTHFYGPECLEVGGNCAMNCKWEEAAWSRLAAYEDTGLEPEQCENAKAIIESAFSDDTSKAERIRELLKADRDGRLVVLLSFTDAVDGYWVWDNFLHEQHKKRETRTATVNGRTMSLYAWGKKLGLNLGALNGYYKAHGKEKTEEKIAEMVRRAKSNGRAVVSR